MLKKLRLRFVCIAMSFVTVMLCVILGMVIHITRQSLEEQGTRLMQAAAMPREFPGRPRDEVRLPYLVIQQGRDGKLIVEGYENLVSGPEEAEQLLNLALDQPEQQGVLKEQSLRYLKSPFPGGQRVVFADISAEQSILADLIRICIGIGVLSFGVFLGLSMLLAKWAVGPVERAWDQQKQFLADASHELKTPLTVVMTNAELLQNRPGEPEEEGHLLEGILTMTRQMRTLVEGMLELARADNGSLKTGFSQVDLSELVEQETLSFETLVFESGRQLECDIAAGLSLRGSATHLRQVLGILLDNAVKYSTPGGKIDLRLIRQGSHSLLSIASPGEPISREDLKNIFKRFYRADKARSRDGSYGLGLSIAQRIVEEHGGRIWAESTGGVNTFRVQLPGNGQG